MLTLISHVLCPYVQRAVIALTEKHVPFERIAVDLANKPDWFTAISPLGKTPVLKVGDSAIFESAVILEYLEETQPHPLHPADPLRRAEHRGWIEFGSAVLNDIAGFYSAADESAFRQKTKALTEKFARLEARPGRGPYFDGERFSLVDVVFGPVFRYSSAFLPANRNSARTGRRLQRARQCATPFRRTTTSVYGNFCRRGTHFCHA
jgi:glutathione S-transferase